MLGPTARNSFPAAVEAPTYSFVPLRVTNSVGGVRPSELGPLTVKAEDGKVTQLRSTEA